eukprot:GHVR01164465.1.p1 GENE.GHVR01164465.1~~GHVR01164465.1.p1  ORF type:complete len:111 (-),score=0.36 GHVR01164465.1:126-458(-)
MIDPLIDLSSQLLDKLPPIGDNTFLNSQHSFHKDRYSLQILFQIGKIIDILQFVELHFIGITESTPNNVKVIRSVLDLRQLSLQTVHFSYNILDLFLAFLLALNLTNLFL